MCRCFKSILGAALLLAMAVCASAGTQDFTLVNATGLAIDKLHVSPANDNTWGEDILGLDVLENGASCHITFSSEQDDCKWDLKIVDADGDAIIWTGLNLCKISKVTLSYEDKKPTATVE